jgi:hypothetical protein
MGSPGSPGPLEKFGVRRMLVVFAVLAIAGVLTLVLSVVIGIVILALAEVFFFLAYRRFKKMPK